MASLTVQPVSGVQSLFGLSMPIDNNGALTGLFGSLMEGFADDAKLPTTATASTDPSIEGLTAVVSPMVLAEAQQSIAPSVLPMEHQASQLSSTQSSVLVDAESQQEGVSQASIVDHMGSVGMSATEQALVANMLLIAQRANTQTELQRLPISVHQQSEGDVAIEDVDRQSLPLNAAAAANVPAGAISSVSDNAFGDKTITFAAPIVSSEVSSRPLSTTMVADNGVNLNATNLMATAVKANHMAQEQDQSFSSKQQAHTDQLLSQLTAQAGDDLQTLSSSDSFSGLMQTLSSTTTLSPNLSGMSTPISLRHPQWSQDIGHRVQMMVNEQINEIELNLDPATLGPMKIKLNMDESQSAHVRLSALHGLTRELLENALPRLRDMLAEQGIQLGSATVDAGSRQQQDTASHQGTKNNVSHTEVDQDADNLHSAPLIKHAIDRLVDQFA